MSPSFWSWVTDHWFLSFILALLTLRMVNKIVGAFIRRFSDPPAVAETSSEPEPEEDETEEDDEEAQPVVVTKVRSRFESCLRAP